MPDQCANQCRGIAEHLLLERLVNDAPIPIAVVEGPELRFVKANPAYRALTGSPEAKLVGRTMAEAFPDAAAHGSLDPHQRAMRTGERISQKELEFLARLGPESPPQSTWWNVELVPLAGEAGCPSSLLIMAEDVTAPVLARRGVEAQAAELREREEWLQLAVEAANGGSWSFDLTTREAEMTDRGLVIHGLPPGEGIDIPRALATIHPEDRDWMAEELNRVVEQPQPFRFEYRVLWPDGTVHWILSQAQVSARPHGPRLVGLVQDITKRKQAEEQLRQLATVAEGSSDFVGIAGLDHQAIYLNPAGRSMVGLADEAAALVTKVEDYFFPEDIPVVRDTILPTVLREGRWKGEVRFRHFQTGEPIAVIWDVFRVDDPRTGQPAQLVTVTRDIRPQKAAEQALRESEELLRLAEHAGNIGSFEWNVQTDDLRVSTGLLGIYGVEPGTFAGGIRSWFERVHPDDVPMMEALIAEVSSTHVPQTSAEFRILRPDGQIRWIEARFALTYDSEGKLARIVGIDVDITERRHAEESLRESEELLRLAEHAGNIGSFEWTPQTDRLRISTGYAAIYGLEAGLLGQSWEAWSRLVHPEDLPWIEALIAETIDRHEPHLELEFRVFRPDGQMRWVEARSRWIYDSQGSLLRVIGINVDITERKQTEEALQASVELLRVAEFAGDTGSFEWNPPTGRLRLSPGCQAVYGFEPVAYDGAYEAWAERLRPEDRQTIVTLIGGAFAEHRTLYKEEYDIVRPDGQTRWLEGRIRITYDAEGRPLRVFGVKVDITDRKRVEESLRESEERFRLATEATTGVVYDWNLTTGYTWRSQGLSDVIGYTTAEMPSMSDGWWGLCHPDDRTQHDRQFAEALAAHAPMLTTEYRIRHKNGHYVWVWDRARLVYDQNGQPVRVIGATVSIDERKRTEERLKALNDTLEQRVVERTAIAEQRAAQLRVLAAELTEAEEQERRRLAKILHDHLQQLLVAARIKTAVLRRRAEDDKLVRTLEQIDDVLNQAITESRSLTVELSPPVLYDAGLAAGLDWLARQIEEKHGLQVEVRADPAAEPTDESTRVFLFQVVRELLLNVVKHAQTDSARVELTPLGDERLRLVVSDEGVGFELAALENRGMSGGFGLFSIRERLELLGGHLTIEASPGIGTRMTVDIPRGRTAVADGATPAETETVAGEATGEERRAPAWPGKTRVVLADDHAIVRQGLAGLLRDQEAIEVVGEAADGRQAVEVTLKTRPDVVLMDVTMPGLNGIEATRRILSLLPQVRVIGLSMHEAADMAAAMRKAGAAAYLRKDTDSDVLVSTILAQHLQAHEA